MDDLELTAQIAKWLGWTKLEEELVFDTRYWTGLPPNSDNAPSLNQIGMSGFATVPQFASDLNAWTSDVWPKLRNETCCELWWDALSEITKQRSSAGNWDRRSLANCANATARQRCEALLIAINGPPTGDIYITMPIAEFDRLARAKEFTDGPYISGFGDGYREPYVGSRLVRGTLKDGRKVQAMKQL